MALNFDLTPEELEGGESPYLKNPEKGLELLCSILERDNHVAYAEEEALQSRVAPLLAGLELDVEMQVYQELAQLSDRMKERQRIALLEGRVVLGVGGQFSAGKSAFINSLAGVSLPENQLPTTSIATYVIHADKRENFALTIRNRKVMLDDEAMQALTHRFYKTYGIGFSRVIRNLVVCTPSEKFARYPHIAILDTPGYSKADTNKMKGAADAELARRMLESVDYLIWLIDSENGTMKNEDREFLLSLNIKTPILFVFNKADMKTEEERRKIVQEADILLKENDIPFYGIIAYDSFRGQVLVGEDKLDMFFQLVNDSAEKRNSVKQQIYRVRADIIASIERRKNHLKKRLEKAKKQIATAVDTEGLEAATNEYYICMESLEKLRQRNDLIMEAFQE